MFCQETKAEYALQNAKYFVMLRYALKESLFKIKLICHRIVCTK